ncbi:MULTISPECIES: ABC transporter substrate-binding protein [unclassified Nocardiopsis]|uniref:ABC transporter substrate-binding protein n=1 Tax=Nocardiopsis TaxID=2013 RepID=UPI00387B3E37
MSVSSLLPSPHRRALAPLALLPLLLTGYSLADTAGGSGTVTVTVGHQSPTINTATAGALIQAHGFFEDHLARVGEETGVEYAVVWEDHDTGAPITAGMLAENIDIGSMGDYPLLINGSRALAQGEHARTTLVSVTGYNPLGALNMVVVPPDSPARTLDDLAGGTVSASIGSAGHGTFVQAWERAGLEPGEVTVVNQQPQVGSSALGSGEVDALAQFVAWPGLLVHRGEARLLYDGSELGVPTLHGVVVRDAFAAEHPEVVQAFLLAQLDATRHLRENPLEAAETVAEASGLPVEVVYLYNGPGGAVHFDPTIKPALVEALRGDTEYLAAIDDFAELDVDAFVDDGPLREAFAAEGVEDYEAALAVTDNPLPITGTDTTCEVEVTDPATAGELWIDGEEATRPAATPECLLAAVRAAQEDGGQVRAAYVPNAATGTRWFADAAVWVLDPDAPEGERLSPFTTEQGALRHLDGRPGAEIVDYDRAVREARP